jgi:hypothetical protein
VIWHIFNFKHKLYNLIKYSIDKYLYAQFYIIRIETLVENHGFLVHFTNKFNAHNIYTKSVKDIFANKKIINRFGSHDAARIGYYCAKSMLKEKIYHGHY